MEEGYLPLKMKRKDLHDVYEDLSDFSLCSPATKIRRLDPELAPIIEEEETVNLAVFGQLVPTQDTFVEQVMGSGSIAVEELSGGVPENKERAIVLFNPMNNTPMLQLRSPFSISVGSYLLSGFKNPVIWSNLSNAVKSSESETEKQDGNLSPSNGCLAVVPWVPSHSQRPLMPETEAPQTEMMDADDTEATTMDIEDNSIQQMPSVSEGLNQWQQYCMIPQPPQNVSTPVT